MLDVRLEVRRRAAEVAVDGLAVGADDRPDVDQLLVGETQADGVELAPLLIGIGFRPPGAVTVSTGPKTCVFETAATLIASGAEPGAPTLAEPEVVAVVAGRDHGDDAGGGDVVHGLDERVVHGVVHRAAAREVDHVHPVGDRVLERRDDLRREGAVPDGRRRVEDAVVAEPGARRDAREALDLGVVGAGRRGRPRVARGDPGDVRAVERRLAVER